MEGNELDFWLSRGYFRMQQSMFTCQFVGFDNAIYAVQWLRIVMPDVWYGKKQLRLLRINEPFEVTVGPFRLTDEVEHLYRHYRASIDFDASESVEACLMGGALDTSFNTYSVEVRDGNRLIAVGIFDQGTRSIAGIMNFYHPAYRRQSLGKYLILQKMKYAEATHKMYYYPGYLVHDYPKFDYKLFACETATEVFDSSYGVWLPFSWETVTRLSIDILTENGINPADDNLPNVG